MKPVPEEIKIKMMEILEQSKTKRSRLGSGVYIGQATPKKFFIPKQPVYKIGHTGNLDTRKDALKLKINVRSIYFIEMGFLPVLAEGLLHGIFSSERARDYIPFEREWFYLSDQNLDWLHSFDALDYEILNRAAWNLAKSFEDSKYKKTDMKLWFRKYHWGG